MDKTLLLQKIAEWKKACDFFASPDIKKQLASDEQEAIVFLCDYWRNNEFDKSACEKRIELLKQCDKLHSSNREIIEKSKTLRGIAQTFYTKDSATFDQFRKEMGWTPTRKPTPVPTPKTTPTPQTAPTPQHNEAMMMINIEKWSKAIQFLKSEAITPLLDIAEMTAIEQLNSFWQKPTYSPMMKEEADELIKVLIASHKLHSSNREIIEHSKNLCAVARKVYDNKETFDLFKKSITEFYKKHQPPRRDPIPQKKKQQQTPIPQQHDSQIFISDVIFADTTYDNEIIKDYSKVLYTNTQYIVPLLIVSSEYYGTEEIEIIIKYPDGQTASYNDEIEFKGKGKYQVTGWGSKSGDSYSHYSYVEYTFKWKGKKIWQGRATIQPDPNSAQYPVITDVIFGATDYDGNIQVNFGSPIPTGIHYLKPRIVVSNNFRGSITLDIEYQYENRKTSRTDSDVTINGPGQYTLSGWGRSEGDYYTEPEKIKVIISYKGKVLSTSYVQIGKPSVFKRKQQTSTHTHSYDDSLWTRFDNKIRDIGEWFEDHEENISGLITILIYIVLVVAVVATLIEEGIIWAIIVGIIGFALASLATVVMSYITTIALWVLQLIFSSAWSFLITALIVIALNILPAIGAFFSIFSSDDEPTSAVEYVVNDDTTTYYCTAQSGVIVRQEPSSSAKQLGGLKYNEEVEVYEIRNGFARISYYGNEAWVSSKFLAIDEGKMYLKENATRKEVKTLPSGLQYEVISKGKGKRPDADSEVLCYYTCSLTDGTVIDSNKGKEAVRFNLTNTIPGWSEGMQLMKEGAHYILYIPAELAFGDGNGYVPARATIIFDVELIEIV